MGAFEKIETPLEPVEYLARSPSRVRVLDAIQEEPRTRNELKEMTEVSRVTVSRILANFEDREWIERTNGRYVATSEGAFVASELTGLLANIDTLEHLDGTMRWLPTDEFDFELTRLRDANVATSSWGDHTAQIRRVADLIQGADRIRATGSGVSRDVVEAIRDATVADGAAFEGIFDTTALEIVRRDPDLHRPHREILEADGEIYRYAGPEEPLLMVTVCDDTVILCGHDEDGPPPGTLDTTDQTVREWAESYIDRIRAAATPVEADVFR